MTDLTNFFNGTGAVNVNTVSVLYFDSSGNVSGGSDFGEQAIFTANATGINNFVGAGGGLFSHASDYGWLTALIPGLAPIDYSDTGLTLTASGNGAFPGLSNSDLSSGPWYQYFTGVGTLPVLATGVGPTGAPVPVILGGSGGSITDPDPIPGVPEPATWAMMILGFGLVGAIARRRLVSARMGTVKAMRQPLSYKVTGPVSGSLTPICRRSDLDLFGSYRHVCGL